MSADGGPTTAEGLNDELRSLLRSAHTNGVEVRGGWECRNGGSYPDWDVVITGVRSADADE